MQLSSTLRTPLDQYVDNYFTSKVKDLSKAFNYPESEIEYVLEFGVREIKRAPSRRSSSRESETSCPPSDSVTANGPTLVGDSKSLSDSVTSNGPTLVGDSKSLSDSVTANGPTLVGDSKSLSDSVTKPSSKSAPRSPNDRSASPETCVHQIKGVNARMCGRGAKYIFEDKWYCKTHLKIYTTKKGKKKVEEKSIAKKIWKKKTLEKKFNFVEEGNYYVDTRTRICVSPNSKEAFGILPENGDVVQPLQEEHLELLAASNLKYRELTSHLDPILSESDDDELILLSSDDSD